jgi:hypothetical protein
MTQQFADFIQGASLPKQASGEGVSKYVRAVVRRLYAGMFQSAPDKRGNRRRICKTD